MSETRALSKWVLVLCMLVAACGGDDDAMGDAGGGADAGAGVDATPSRQPPPPGPLMPPDGTGEVTFAIDHLYLGDTNRDGTPNMANGWKQFGFDLDHKLSTATSTDLCMPRNSASASNVYPDGADGIDNSFGKNLLPILLGISSDYSAQTNDALVNGKHALLLSLHQLGTGADYNPIVTRWYLAGDLMATPKFDGTDMWPVDDSSLTDPADVATARTLFQDGYVVGNTWVSGSKQDLVLQLGGPFVLKLPIAGALISMDLDGAHAGVVNGTIAGVVPTDALVTEFRRLMGNFDPSLCMGPTIDSIVTQIEMASDIMSDGSQNPAATCDGVTIGIGFTAKLDQLGAIVNVAQPPDPCP